MPTSKRRGGWSWIRAVGDRHDQPCQEREGLAASLSAHTTTRPQGRLTAHGGLEVETRIGLAVRASTTHLPGVFLRAAFLRSWNSRHAGEQSAQRHFIFIHPYMVPWVHPEFSVAVFALWHGVQRSWHLSSSARTEGFESVMFAEMSKLFSSGSIWSNSRLSSLPQRTHLSPRYASSFARRV